MAVRLQHAMQGPHNEQMKNLHDTFVFKDSAGGLWTISMTTLEWYHLASGKWTSANATETLQVEEALFFALRSLPAVRAAKPNAAPIIAGQSPGSASHEQGLRFCTNQNCKKEIAPLRRFCTFCGTPSPN